MKLSSYKSKCLIMLMLTAQQLVSATTEGEGTDFCKAWRVWNVYYNECQCAPIIPHHHVSECNSDHTNIDYRACATYDREDQATLVGICPFNSLDVHYDKKFASTLRTENINLTSQMCDPLNRTGVLCSLCKPGLGPALLNYSHPCLKCSSYGWVEYLSATFIPATIFLLVIAIFQIDATSPSLSFIILHSHILTIFYQQNPNILHSSKHYGNSYLVTPAITVILTYYGIWNLDFFRLLLPSFCANSYMNIYTVLALLQYIL